MLAFSNDYYGFIFRATQSVELFCAYERKEKQILKKGIAAIAKRTAMVEVNTVCPLIAFQPEVPEELKKLRKF